MANIAGILVVGVWLVMAGVLMGGGPETSTDTVGAGVEASSGMESGEQWMGIYLEGTKAGYAHSSVSETGGGYAITEEMVIAFTVQGAGREIHSRTTSEVDRDLTLRRFEFSLRSGMADMEIKGVVDGLVMRLDIASGGSRRTTELKLDETPHLSSDIELYLKREGLAVGKKYRLPFFDPSTLSRQYMDLTVEGLEEMKLGARLVPVYRVRQEYAGVTATAWINPDVGMVKGEGVMGFTFLRETKEQAMRKPGGGFQTADIIAMNSIKASGNLPSDPRAVKYLRAELSGADLSGLDIDGYGQTFRNGIIGLVEVDREQMPMSGAARLPLSGPGLDEYLKPTPFVQSDDPEIVKKAAEVIGGETDALRAARKLGDWVYRSVKKQPTTGVPSAAEVLGNLTGDCNEHTTLFTALARSAGIPTRMAGGIVMMDGRFYYHAWPEVYAGEWVSLDPTFGQFPADATHIRLVEGGLDKQIVIAKVVGKLKVEVMESR